MFLTDSTQVRRLANGRVVVSEGTAPAVFIPHEDLFICGDLYEGEPAWVAEANKDPEFEGWYPDFPSDMIQSCTAWRVGFDNGSACCAGHRHVNTTTERWFDAEADLMTDGRFFYEVAS